MNDLRTNLRSSLRKTRNATSASDQAEAARLLASRTIPLLDDCEHVAGYFAVGGEIQVDEILQAIRARDGFSYAPILSDGNTLSFAPFTNSTPFVNNKFKIKEPDVDSSRLKHATDLDAVLVPLVGFDLSRNRMGMGGGFYDRSFAHRRDNNGKPLLIGVAYDIQQADTVYPEWWDVKLDIIVTESRIIR